MNFQSSLILNCFKCSIVKGQPKVKALVVVFRLYGSNNLFLNFG